MTNTKATFQHITAKKSITLFQSGRLNNCLIIFRRIVTSNPYAWLSSFLAVNPRKARKTSIEISVKAIQVLLMPIRSDR